MRHVISQMKNFLRYLLVPVLIAAGLSFSSCGDDDDDDKNPFSPATPSFASANKSTSFSNLGGTLELAINDCNGQTYVYPTVSWISVLSFETRGECSFEIAKNETSEARSGNIQLRENGRVVDIYTINQKAGQSGSGNDDNPSDEGEFGAPTLIVIKSGYTVTLSWNKVPGAEKYWIYYSNPTAFSSGYFVTTKSTTSTTFDMDCKIAGNWAFKVQAQKGSTYSEYSNIATTYISEADINGGNVSQKPATPTGLRAVQVGQTIEVTWNSVPNAYYYRLWYSTPDGKEDFTNVYAPQTSAVFENYMKNGTYKFWIQTLNSNYEESEKSAKVSCTFSAGSGGGNGGGGSNTPSKLDTPTDLTLLSYSTDSYVQLTCKAVPLGYDYQLYRSTSPYSGYSKITASTGTNASGTIVYFTDQNPLKGTSYYKVKVSALPSLGIKDSDYSEYLKVVR